MDTLTPYWQALLPFGIEGPCRVYLEGPFETDEVALRFLLHQLGFTLLDRWNANAAQWTIYGRGREEAKPPAGARQTSEEELYPALFSEIASPFYLIDGGPARPEHRRNLFRLLKSPEDKNVELGLTLLDKGGVNTSLLTELLAALYLQREDRGRFQLFLRHITPYLPDELAELIRDEADSLPFRLGYVQEKLPLFSPLRFIGLLEEEQCFPLKKEEPLKGLYAATAEERLQAWQKISEGGSIRLDAEQLWIFADMPAEGPAIELAGALSLWGAVRPECLDKLLGRHPRFFTQLESLSMEKTGTEAVRIIGAEARQLRSLRLDVSFTLSLGALLEGLATNSLRALDVGSTHRRRAEIGLPSKALPKASEMAPKIEELSIAGFRSLDLTGIGQFRNLKSLRLADNQLEALPSSIGELQQLQDLHLFEVKLRSLPRSFYRLPLKNIWLGNNRLPNHTRVLLNRVFPDEAFRYDEGLWPRPGENEH